MSKKMFNLIIDLEFAGVNLVDFRKNHVSVHLNIADAKLADAVADMVGDAGFELTIIDTVSGFVLPIF